MTKDSLSQRVAPELNSVCITSGSLEVDSSLLELDTAPIDEVSQG